MGELQFALVTFIAQTDHIVYYGRLVLFCFLFFFFTTRHYNIIIIIRKKIFNERFYASRTGVILYRSKITVIFYIIIIFPEKKNYNILYYPFPNAT